jgi:hypothetical protein
VTTRVWFALLAVVMVFSYETAPVDFDHRLRSSMPVS